MPQITSKVSDLQLEGAKIEIWVFPPLYAIPNTMNTADIPYFVGTGLIDTGASSHSIN